MEGKPSGWCLVLENEERGEGFLATITFPTPSWVDELKQSYSLSDEVLQLLNKLENNQGVPKGYSLHQCLILKKVRLVVVAESPFKTKVLQYIHVNPTIRHSGYLKTYQRVKRGFFFRGIKILRGWSENATFSNLINMDYSSCRAVRATPDPTISLVRHLYRLYRRSAHS